MIERKYKIENDRLVRRDNGVPIPDDEPLFILRAQDVKALPILIAYKIICRDINHVAGIVKAINDFTNFRDNHPERMKEPD